MSDMPTVTVDNGMVYGFALTTELDGKPGLAMEIPDDGTYTLLDQSWREVAPGVMVQTRECEKCEGGGSYVTPVVETPGAHHSGSGGYRLQCPPCGGRGWLPVGEGVTMEVDVVLFVAGSALVVRLERSDRVETLMADQEKRMKEWGWPSE